MDGPVKILRRDWPAVNHREKHPYGSMDLDSTLTAADPLLFRDLGRSASLYRPFPPNARPHPLLHPCFLRAPLSQLQVRKWLRFQPKNFPFFGKSKLDPCSLAHTLLVQLVS